MEQILIMYQKNDNNFLLSIVAGENRKSFTEETEEAKQIINKIKELI